VHIRDPDEQEQALIAKYRRGTRPTRTDFGMHTRNAGEQERAVVPKHRREELTAQLEDDFSRCSFVVVTRGPGLDPSEECITTAIAGNQPRGIQGVMNVLANPEAKILKTVFEQFHIGRTFPPCFQLLFWVEITQAESRYKRVEPVLYREYPYP
jgi:hypothetical protein